MPIRGSRRFAMIGLVGVSLAVSTVLGATPVRAASCNGASHLVTLTSGMASPASGQAGTVVTFSVTYASNAACPPIVTIAVNGFGTYAMSGTGTDFAAGVVFQFSAALPAGTYPYAFRATSGSGSGTQSLTLTSVSPAAVTIVAPAPVVVPPPAPAPPTATPVTPSTPEPTASPTPTATLTGTSAPSEAAALGAGNGGDGRGHAAPREGSPVARGSASAAVLPGTVTGMMLWLTATAAGLAWFVLLGRRRAKYEGSPIDAWSPPVRPASVRILPAPRFTSDHEGEAQVARWLRPSVQAARFADPGRDGPPGDA